MAAGPAPCTNSHHTILKNVVQLAQEKCPLNVLKTERKIYRTPSSIDLWIDFPQTMSEWPQKPPNLQQQQHLAYGYGILNCVGQLTPCPVLQGTVSDVTWCVPSKGTSGVTWKAVITSSPHLIQKKVLHSSGPSNPTTTQPRAKAHLSHNAARCPEDRMRNSNRQVHSYQLGGALHPKHASTQEIQSREKTVPL